MASSDDPVPDNEGDQNDIVVPAEIEGFDSLLAMLKEDPMRIWEDPVIDRLAMSKNDSSDRLWAKISGFLSGFENINANKVEREVNNRAEELKDNSSGTETAEVTEPDPPEEPEESLEWHHVVRLLSRSYDQRFIDMMEAHATVPVRMLMTGTTDCPAVIGLGNASTGKSTSSSAFDGLGIVDTHDMVTKASWVSHSEQNQDGQFDLLPKVAQHVLHAPEMGPWFSGDNVEEEMATLARVLDGEGLRKTTGARGTTGYHDPDGKYRFGIIGATTPPSPQAWNAMGDNGSRFVFFPMGKLEDEDQLIEESRQEYNEVKHAAKELISQWWATFWHEHDGEITTENQPEVTDAQRRSIIKLTKIMSYGRQPDYGEETGVDRSEQVSRARDMFIRMVQARALMYDRDQANADDLKMIAKAAFASIPQWRQPVVKMLVSPHSEGPYTAKEIQEEMDVTNKTAHRKMKEAKRIGLANIYEEGDGSSHQTKKLLALQDKSFRGVFSEADEPVKNYAPVPWPEPEDD